VISYVEDSCTTHQCFMSRLSSRSSILRPIRCFVSKTVFFGLVVSNNFDTTAALNSNAGITCTTHQRFMSHLSSILRQIRCFMSKTVFIGLEWNAFSALSPTLQAIIQYDFWFSGCNKLTAARHPLKLTHEASVLTIDTSGRINAKLGGVNSLPRSPALEK
jgi:hypothetical protein